MSSLRGYLDALSFKNFMPEGKLHHFLDRFGKPGGGLADAGILTHRMGLYPGDYLAEWLGPILHDQLGVRTFADLKIEQADDPGMSLPADRGTDWSCTPRTSPGANWSTSPGTTTTTGVIRDTQDVVAAVRASMSIPFFFEPVTFTALPAEVDIPTPGGGVIRTHYDGGAVTWVDGGMLRNFPIDAFARVDGEPPALADHRHQIVVAPDDVPGRSFRHQRIRGGQGVPAHHDERVGRLQRRRLDGGPDHLRGQRRDHGH